MLVFKVVAKLTCLVANIEGHVKVHVGRKSLVTTHFQIYDQTKFHMVKGIDNAFDHMELFYLINRRIISVKIGFFLQDITLIT